MFSVFLELEIYVRYLNLKRWMPYNKYMKWEDYHYIINYEPFNDDNISYLPVNFFWELDFEFSFGNNKIGISDFPRQTVRTR